MQPFGADAGAVSVPLFAGAESDGDARAAPQGFQCGPNARAIVEIRRRDHAPLDSRLARVDPPRAGRWFDLLAGGIANAAQSRAFALRRQSQPAAQTVARPQLVSVSRGRGADRYQPAMVAQRIAG